MIKKLIHKLRFKYSEIYRQEWWDVVWGPAHDQVEAIKQGAKPSEVMRMSRGQSQTTGLH